MANSTREMKWQILIVAVAFVAGLFIGITVGTLIGENRMLDFCQKQAAVCAPRQG